MNSTQSTSDVLRDRYPTKSSRRSSRALAVVLTILVVALGVAIAYVGYSKFADQDLSTKVLSYRVVNDSTIDMQFSLTRKQPGDAAVCIVRALSKDGSESGRREVLIPPSGNGTQAVRTTIRTSTPPGLADVYGCTYHVPPYLKAS